MIFKFYFLIFVVFSNILVACTIFDIKNKNNEVLVGRNFDWDAIQGQINFIPPKHTEYGMVLISLDNAHMPYEGMNTQGLFIAIAAVPSTKTKINILKPIRKSLEMIEEVLKKSSNITEAIVQFEKYSIAFGEFLGYPLVHFKIVQKDGKSVIIEFVNGEMVVLENDVKIMTNHYLSNTTINSENPSSNTRYEKIYQHIEQLHTIDDVFKILNSTRQNNTIWSSSYNLTTQEIYLQYKNDEIIKFNLKDTLYNQHHPYFYDLYTKKQAIATDNKISLFIRPHFGYGDNNQHIGARILSNSNNHQAYGLEFTKIKTNHEEFEGVGIVLEQRLWDWFNMSIGTIGYFNYGLDDENTIGLVSNLGWEPHNTIPFKPFITWRNDIVFAKDTKNMSSISFGFRFDF